MSMAGATVNPAAGGPVGGGIMMMNNGGSPAVAGGNGPNSDRSPEHIKIMLNTYVYEYFLKLGYYDIARVLATNKQFEYRSMPSKPEQNKDGDVNGVDPESMDTDLKGDIPDDLPRPAGAGSESSMQGNGFLFEWFSVFSDLFAAHRNSHKSGNPTPAMQYLLQHQQLQRMRENQQNASLQRPPGMMNPQFMRNGQMRNGMVNGDGKIQTRLTPQQLAHLQAQKNAQQMQQQLSRDQSEGDPNARPVTPADGDIGGSPSKRPRLENPQQFNPNMMPNGRPGVQGVGQTNMMMQAGFNPNINPAQFRQNGGMPNKPMAANMTNGIMNIPNAGSPMMANMGQFPDGNTMEMYRGMGAPGMQGAPNGQSGNHALQDYQMQLMLLEQQNKKRLMMARQEQHESTNPRDGQPMAGGVGMQPPGMSPSGRSGTSPNPTDQMKRTPQIGGMPGSPMGGDLQRGSPGPMNFMNGMPGPEFNQAMFMKDGQMMGPGGPNMRPPTSADMNALNRQQQGPPQQQQARMQFPGGQPMQQQPSQGQPQPVGTPGQRNNDMPPPQAPAANNSAQRNNQPASPANSNAPPTPSQTNKPNPKNKKNNKQDGAERKRPAKKNSTANAPNNDENPPATPTPSTPITPGQPGPFNNSAGKGPGQGGPPPNQQPPPNAGMHNNQQQMQDPNLQSNDFGFGPQDPNFNLDFSQLDSTDVLENFDFDSFLNTSNDDGTFNFDGGMGVDGFSMDPNEG